MHSSLSKFVLFRKLEICALACHFCLAFLHNLETCSLNVRKLSIFIPSNFSDLVFFTIKSSKFKSAFSFDVKKIEISLGLPKNN